MAEITIPITKPVVIQQFTAEEWELFTCDHAPPGVKQATRALNTALVKAVKQYFKLVMEGMDSKVAAIEALKPAVLVMRKYWKNGTGDSELRWHMAHEFNAATGTEFNPFEVL